MDKVILVDDEPYVIEGLKTMIDWGKFGYRICGEASNGEDALQMIRELDPDLVVTDIRMPGLDGLQLIRQSREDGNSRVKFIILSGYDDFSYIQHAMKYGINDYLLKPIDDEEMNDILDRLRSTGQKRTSTKGKGSAGETPSGSRGEVPLEENAKRKTAPKEGSHKKDQELEKLNRYLAPLLNPTLEMVTGATLEELENHRQRASFLLNIADTQEIRCLLIEVDSYSCWMNTCTGACLEEPEFYDKTLELKAILMESLPKTFQERLFDLEAHRFALIVSPDMEIYHHLQEYLTNLQGVLKRRCNFNISAAISEAKPGLGSLEELYRQVALAIQYKFFHGEGSMIYYADIKNTPLSDNFCNTPLGALLEDIKNNDCHGMQEKIDMLFQEFARNLSKPEVIKAYLQNLMLEVIKHSVTLNADISVILEKIMKLNEKFDGGSALTIGDLRAGFSELCECAAHYLSAIGDNNSRDIIGAVKSYVKENYAKDISLQKLAKHFYMNPVYLGQLFKRCEGRQFSEYLHQTRIEEAKKLLRRTNMKISEIAYAIGYHDPEYFVSKFKSITQVPPSAFKKS